MTFITAFKKFRDLQDQIQLSALYSWQVNDIAVVTAINEIGQREKLSSYPNVKLVQGVRTGRDLGFSTGAVVIKDLLLKGLLATETQLVALVKGDVIIPPDFNARVKKIVDMFGYDIFLIGHRRSIQTAYCADSPDTYKRLCGEPHTQEREPNLFLTSRFMMRKLAIQMPEFIFGRFYWDTWIHQWAVQNVHKIMDCTDTLPTYHCVHPMNHIYQAEGAHGTEADSAKYNKGLIDGFSSCLLR